MKLVEGSYTAKEMALDKINALIAIVEQSESQKEVIRTARVVRETGSTKRYGVRPYVRLSVPFVRYSSLRRVCYCGPGRYHISIDCCSSGVHAADECGQCHVVSVCIAELELFVKHQSFTPVISVYIGIVLLRCDQ